MSYNILAEAYTKERNMINQYSTKKQTPEVVQDFDYRSRRIIKEIFGCSANQTEISDRICLQEVDNFENVYKPEFDKRGYGTEMYWRSEQDGVLIGYNKQKFEILDS